jgi:hypothetical protein
VDFAAMRRLQDVIGKVNGCRSVVETLRAVVEGVVEVVGFGAAAVSLVHADGTFEVLAVAGDSSARAELLGQREPADAYDTEFALAEPWGSLLFVPHERLPGGRGIGWVPDIELLDVPDAWHPQDALFAPLRSPAGELVGMLSVDCRGTAVGLGWRSGICWRCSRPRRGSRSITPGSVNGYARVRKRSG